VSPKSLASTIYDLHLAIENCKCSGNSEWLARHSANLKKLYQRLPSGSGIDNGTTVHEISTTPERITLSCSFHHMNDQGSYDGWTEHRIYVTPSFSGLNVRVTGRDRNDIKDYLGEIYMHCMTERVIYDNVKSRWVGEYEGMSAAERNGVVVNLEGNVQFKPECIID